MAQFWSIAAIIVAVLVVTLLIISPSNKKAFLAFHNGRESSSIELLGILPPTALLSLSKLDGPTNFGTVWNVAHHGISLPNRLGVQEYFAIDQNLFVRIRAWKSNEPLLTGIRLPVWNLKGTAADAVSLTKPIVLVPGATYELVFQFKDRIFARRFRVQDGSVYASSEAA